MAFEFLFVSNITPNHPYGNAFQESLNHGNRAAQRWIGTKTSLELVELFDAASGMVHFSPAGLWISGGKKGFARDLKLFAARVGGVVDIGRSARRGYSRGLVSLTQGAGALVQRALARTRRGPSYACARYHPEVIVGGTRRFIRRCWARNNSALLTVPPAFRHFVTDTEPTDMCLP